MEARVAYQHKMAGDAKVLESFVLSQLGKELVEFQSDRQKVSENFQKLEQFVVHALSKEIREFAIDKRDLAETKVKLVREAKSKFEDIKTNNIISKDSNGVPLRDSSNNLIRVSKIVGDMAFSSNLVNINSFVIDYNSLIDVGSYLLGLNNETVAKQICNKFDNIDRCIYYVAYTTIYYSLKC